MPRNRKVNQADVQAIVAGTIRGKKQKDIAKEIGLGQQSVSQTLRTPEGIATMREMLAGSSTPAGTTRSGSTTRVSAGSRS